MSETGRRNFETHLTAETYRFDFASDDDQEDTLKRAFGCLLVALMPDSGIDDAVSALFDSFTFATEDERLVHTAPVETIGTGLVVDFPGLPQLP
jgi:hypothetical protein